MPGRQAVWRQAACQPKPAGGSRVPRCHAHVKKAGARKKGRGKKRCTAGIRRGGNGAGNGGVSISAGKRGRGKWPQDLCVWDACKRACVCGGYKGPLFLVCKVRRTSKGGWAGARTLVRPKHCILSGVRLSCVASLHPSPSPEVDWRAGGVRRRDACVFYFFYFCGIWCWRGRLHQSITRQIGWGWRPPVWRAAAAAPRLPHPGMRA